MLLSGAYFAPLLIILLLVLVILLLLLFYILLLVLVIDSVEVAYIGAMTAFDLVIVVFLAACKACLLILRAALLVVSSPNGSD